jgi:WD40 repeat protein
MGFKADIIVWDLTTKQVHKKLALHKVMVRALDFSFNESKLASLGGPDDASLVLWDVATGEAMCGSPTSGKFLETVKFLNQKENHLATAGQGVRPFRTMLTVITAHPEREVSKPSHAALLIVCPDRGVFMYCKFPGHNSSDELQRFWRMCCQNV